MKIKEIKEIKEINLMNVLLCFSVIMIHLTSSPLTVLNKENIWYLIIFILNKSLCFCVPAFLFLSGFKLYNKYKEENIEIKEYAIGRIKKILIPYVISLSIYFVYFLIKDWIDLKNIVEYFLLGTLVAHFYYVIIALQCYVFFPLIKKIFIKYDKWVLILSLLSTILFQVFVSFKYSDRFIGSYVFYFVFGMFIAKYVNKINITRLSKFLIVPYGIVACIHIGLSYLSNLGKYTYLNSGLINIIYAVLAILVLYGICTIIYTKREKQNKFIQIINGDAYYIYLYHILLMHILQNEILSYFNLSMRHRFIISIIVVYFVIISICSLKNKIKIELKNRK